MKCETLTGICFNTITGNAEEMTPDPAEQEGHADCWLQNGNHYPVDEGEMFVGVFKRTSLASSLVHSLRLNG